MRQTRLHSTHLLATDRQGSVLAEVIQVGLRTRAYTAYGGEPLNAARPGSQGFCGQVRDASGLYLLGNGHRAYNPHLMRFTRPDKQSPFARGGLNAYGYCVGDPVNLHDPTGEFAALFGKVLTGVLGVVSVGATVGSVALSVTGESVEIAAVLGGIALIAGVGARVAYPKALPSASASAPNVPRPSLVPDAPPTYAVAIQQPPSYAPMDPYPRVPSYEAATIALRTIRGNHSARVSSANGP